MLGHSPYYHQMTRKYIIAFAKIFNDIQIIRTDSVGNIVKTIKVPVTYAGKEKIFYYLTQRNEAKVVNTILPRISFIITDAQVNRERALNNTNTVRVGGDPDTEDLIYSGVPYDFTIVLSIWGKNMDDVLQIFEQIAPFFKPDYTITLNEIKELNIQRNVPILLNDVQFDVSTDLDIDDTRNVYADLSFTLQGYLYPPITDSKIIKLIDVDIKDLETFELLTTIHIDNRVSVSDTLSFTDSV